MQLSPRSALRAGAAIVAVLILAGCTSHTPTRTIVPDPPATAKTGFNSGEVVPDGTTLLDTQRSYKMSNGAFVVVNITGDLPSTVLTNISTGAAPAETLTLYQIDTSGTPAATAANKANYDAGVVAMQTYLAAQIAMLGRNLYFVYQIENASQGTGSKALWLAMGPDGKFVVPVGDRPTTLAAVQALADPTNTTIVIIQ